MYPILVRIPLAPRSKQPLVHRWSTLPADSPVFTAAFKDHPDANVGIRLDDLVVVDCDSPERVEWWLDQGFETEFMSRGNPERRSFWYRRPEGCVLEPVWLRPNVELRTGSGQQCVVPPSVHPDTGRPYEWLGPPVDEEHWLEIPEAPVEALIKLLGHQSRHNGASGPGFDVVETGGRDDFLTSVGGLLRARGLSEGGIRTGLSVLNQVLCHPPKSAADVERIAHSMGRYDTEVDFAMDDGLYDNLAGEIDGLR